MVQIFFTFPSSEISSCDLTWHVGERGVWRLLRNTSKASLCLMQRLHIQSFSENIHPHRVSQHEQGPVNDWNWELLHCQWVHHESDMKGLNVLSQTTRATYWPESSCGKTSLDGILKRLRQIDVIAPHCACVNLSRNCHFELFCYSLCHINHHTSYTFV